MERPPAVTTFSLTVSGGSSRSTPGPECSAALVSECSGRPPWSSAWATGARANTIASENRTFRKAIMLLLQFHCAADFVAQLDTAHGQRHLGWQHFSAFEPSARHSLAHRLFDFPLRGDADGLEKLPHAGVEHVFVHALLPF